MLSSFFSPTRTSRLVHVAEVLVLHVGEVALAGDAGGVLALLDGHAAGEEGGLALGVGAAVVEPPGDEVDNVDDHDDGAGDEALVVLGCVGGGEDLRADDLADGHADEGRGAEERLLCTAGNVDGHEGLDVSGE